MLPSQTLVSSNSVSLCRQHSAKTLQRAQSGSLSILPTPSVLRRSDSGPVPAANLVGHVLLQSRNDQAADRRLDEAAELHLQQIPVSQLATTMSPTKQRNKQEFKANIGTAVRYLTLYFQSLLLSCADSSRRTASD